MQRPAQGTVDLLFSEKIRTHLNMKLWESIHMGTLLRIIWELGSPAKSRIELKNGFRHFWKEESKTKKEFCWSIKNAFRLFIKKKLKRMKFRLLQTQPQQSGRVMATGKTRQTRTFALNKLIPVIGYALTTYLLMVNSYSPSKPSR